MKKIIYLLMAVALVSCGKHKKQQDTTVRQADKVVVERPNNYNYDTEEEAEEAPQQKVDTVREKKRSGGGSRRSGKAYMNDESFNWANQELDSAIMQRIQGRSWRADCPLDPADFAYIRFSHHNFHGGVSTGEMIISRKLADEVLQIFYELYQEGYPIERVRLVDDYGANDEASMAANNTSCFNYREMTNVAAGGKISKHALGRAIDLNPLYNPYVKEQKDGTLQVLPHAGRPYADRTDSINNPYRIDEQDAAYRIFKRHGWRWGGDYRHSKDYQHFEK